MLADANRFEYDRLIERQHRGESNQLPDDAIYGRWRGAGKQLNPVDDGERALLGVEHLLQSGLGGRWQGLPDVINRAVGVN